MLDLNLMPFVVGALAYAKYNRPIMSLFSFTWGVAYLWYGGAYIDIDMLARLIV